MDSCVLKKRFWSMPSVLWFEYGADFIMKAELVDLLYDGLGAREHSCCSGLKSV